MGIWFLEDVSQGVGAITPAVLLRNGMTTAEIEALMAEVRLDGRQVNSSTVIVSHLRSMMKSTNDEIYIVYGRIPLQDEI